MLNFNSNISKETISVIDYILDTYLPLEQVLNDIQTNTIPQYAEENKDCWIRVFSKNTGETFLVNKQEIIFLNGNNLISESNFNEVLNSLK